jgi:hypothetical protein
MMPSPIAETISLAKHRRLQAEEIDAGQGTPNYSRRRSDPRGFGVRRRGPGVAGLIQLNSPAFENRYQERQENAGRGV